VDFLQVILRFAAASTLLFSMKENKQSLYYAENCLSVRAYILNLGLSILYDHAKSSKLIFAALAPSFLCFELTRQLFRPLHAGDLDNPFPSPHLMQLDYMGHNGVISSYHFFLGNVS